MYTTNVRPESKVRGRLPLINPEPEGRGVYQWQTSDDRGQGHMFVVYTVMAVVHMIYTMMKSYWYLVRCIIQQKPVTMFSTHCISLPSDSAAF